MTFDPNRRRLNPAEPSLVTLPVLDSSRQIECNEREAGLSFRGILESEDVLMALRSGLELQTVMAVDVFVVDLDMAVTAFFRASQPF